MTTQAISTFFSERVPAGWFTGVPSVQFDDEEILCVGALPPGSSAAAFREATRPDRIAIAADAEARFGRHVSWGVVVDGVTTQFTSRSTPAMTRLASPSAPCWTRSWRPASREVGATRWRGA